MLRVTRGYTFRNTQPHAPFDVAFDNFAFGPGDTRLQRKMKPVRLRRTSVTRPIESWTRIGQRLSSLTALP